MKGKKSIIKKAKRAVVLVKVLSTAAVVAMTVYSLIPKSESVSGIDTDLLTEKYSA